MADLEQNKKKIIDYLKTVILFGKLFIDYCGALLELKCVW
jgi:hypothetical protein